MNNIENGKDAAKLTDFPRHKENPFIGELLNIKKKNRIIGVAQDKLVVDTVTGELENVAFTAIKKEVDREEFIKIYQSSLREFFELNKATLKVLGHLMSVTQYNDRIFFELDDCKEYTGYRSTETIFKGLRELVDRGIIAKSLHSSVYFINPKVFYKGDRLLIIKEYRVRKSLPALNPNQTKLFNDAPQIQNNSESQ